MDIIQLRQEDSAKINSNGDYEVTLPQPVILNPGDELAIKNCFIDTKNLNDNEIVLNNDINIDITFVRCIRNYGNIPEASLILGKNNDNKDTLLDGELYMECFKKDVPPQGYSTYITVNLTQTSKAFPKIETVNYRFEYTDINGKQTTKVIPINNQWINQKPFGYVQKVKLNIIAYNGSVDFLDADLAKKHGMKLDPGNEYDTTPYNKSDYFMVQTEDVLFTLSAGNYTVSQFCELFNRELTESLPVSGDPIGNKFLSYTREVDTVAKVSQPFIRLDGNGILYQNYAVDTKNYFFGTNQVALEFDDQDQVFKLLNHFPIYNNNNLGVQFNSVKNYNQAGAEITIRKPFGSYACILFTHLSAKDSITNNDIGLFDKILGFDLEKLLVDIEYEDRSLDGLANVDIPYLTDPNFTNPGISYSQALLSIDDFVDKSPTDTTFSNYKTTNFFNVNNDFTYIRSNNKFNELTDNPYYLIEITGYNTNFTSTETIQHSIAGIVSRYYSVGSYTTSGTESSIPMINNGIFPLNLQSFNIRILSPDGELITDLGNDNTIFLQHIRAQIKSK